VAQSVERVERRPQISVRQPIGAGRNNHLTRTGRTPRRHGDPHAGGVAGQDLDLRTCEVYQSITIVQTGATPSKPGVRGSRLKSG
jgi:hypothetical protein